MMCQSGEAMPDANVAAEPSMDEILELNELGIHDINNVQGMILFNIGDAEMSVGELILRATTSPRTSPTTSRRWSSMVILCSSARYTTAARFRSG
jgi:hypothetical protein